MMIYTFMLACSLFSMPFLDASLDHSDLKKENFLAYCEDLTEERLADCVRAMKRNFAYCSFRNEKGYDPLELIIKRYVNSSPLNKRERDFLEALFEELFKSGALFQNDVDSRLTTNDFLKSSPLMEIAKKYIEILRPQFNYARDAIVNKDIHALELIVKPYPKILEMRDPYEKVTLLHVAADKFDLEAPQSVQIFAYLIRMGADVDMSDNEGNSMAVLMHESTHKASELFKAERAALRKRAVTRLTLPLSVDQVKKIVVPVYEKVRPYSLYIAGGICLLGIVWYVSRSKSHEMPTQTNHTIKLQKVT
jgi:hypothetical protein